MFISAATITTKDIPSEYDEIHGWIKKSLPTNTSEYRIYMFIIGVTQNLKYRSIGSKIEEDTLSSIFEFVDDEDLMQYIVEKFLLFLKMFSSTLANFNWDSTKKMVNAKHVNGLMRNMDNNNINPDIFKEIYGFADYFNSQKTKKV